MGPLSTFVAAANWSDDSRLVDKWARHRHCSNHLSVSIFDDREGKADVHLVSCLMGGARLEGPASVFCMPGGQRVVKPVPVSMP
jgi:hypothetical protein